MIPANTVTVLAEIPEPLHSSLRDYLNQHPTWDEDQVITVALALFLLQNSNTSDPVIAQIYLEAQFGPTRGN